MFSDEENQELLHYFRTETENFAEEIDIANFNIDADKFEEYYELLLFCSPRSYYLIADTGTYEYFYPSTTVNSNGEEIIEYLYPIYQLDIYDAEYYIDYTLLDQELPEIEENQERFDNLTDEILSSIPNGHSTSDLTKLMYIHDYIIQNYSYDFDNSINDEYGNACKRNNIRFIADNLPIACQTYSILFNYLAMSVGIETSFVTSVDQSGASYHTWNLVKLAAPQNGNVPKWYHIDVTWDDTIRPDGSGSSMKYFLVSDTKMREDHNDFWDGDRYITYPEINLDFGNEFNDIPWRDTCSQMIEYNNGYYYLTYDMYTGQTNLNKLTDDSNEVIYSYSGFWMYADTYSGLVFSDDKLYFNTAYDIIEYDITSEEASVIPVDSNNETIYSCYSDNGMLYYNLSEDIYTSNVTTIGPLKTGLDVSEPEIQCANGGGPKLVLNFQADLAKSIRLVVKETSSDGVSQFHSWNKDDFTGNEDAVIELSDADSKISVYIWNENMVPYQDAVVINDSNV
ncbi:MAG: transglutaminase domain-containing protein [Candidatus Ornithomonoglobus sp.]